MLRRIARMSGPCVGCGQMYQRGERVVFRTVYHEACDPGAFGGLPAPERRTESALKALAALETAVVERAREQGVNGDLERLWDRYQKVKALALQPGTGGEEQAAVRFALIEAVKMVF